MHSQEHDYIVDVWIRLQNFEYKCDALIHISWRLCILIKKTIEKTNILFCVIWAVQHSIMPDLFFSILKNGIPATDLIELTVKCEYGAMVARFFFNSKNDNVSFPFICLLSNYYEIRTL